MISMVMVENANKKKDKTEQTGKSDIEKQESSKNERNSKFFLVCVQLQRVNPI